MSGNQIQQKKLQLSLMDSSSMAYRQIASASPPTTSSDSSTSPVLIHLYLNPCSRIGRHNWSVPLILKVLDMNLRLCLAV